MVIQERSARTRRRLVLAAAAEIDENGYDRATLARICSRAHVSMGALTFHFTSKRELADAVRADARAIVDDRTRQLVSAPAPALTSLVRLTVGLVQLLETDGVVRSAARLARDCPDGDGWVDTWLPVVRRLVVEAQCRRELRPEVDPQVMAALVVHLVAGAEAAVRTGVDEAPVEVAAQMKRLWAVVLRGVATRV
ncbi:ScbR family autoregulator-binding transcription factor [Streptomyces sp. DT2A-34]|uniref:ScbR family autoregulator-binding transcription factor n=1 Tax=Streptomyces sp. DT2A-34 TaxID=3051182 RepID=UPI00265BBC51|nr:ScbR family autoregulator-binding transcription factor [Streptomyces sp. DT2A-34]MDO0914699.1 ScbR family autoregulator-binding transcription factor [Streptomyces sp. DT2A-34]